MLLKIKTRLRNWFSALKFKKKKSEVVSTHHLDTKLLRQIRGRKFPSWSQIVRIRYILSPWEKRLFYTSFVLFLLGLSWAGILFLNNFKEKVPAIGGSYVEAVVGSPQFINPLFANVNDVDLDISRLVYSGLLKYNENQELVPDLAESYEVSPDKKTYTFKLRENVKWHDDEPFTASDVVFTIDAIQEPSVNSSLFVSFQNLEVKAVDDRTVRFTLKEPFTAFLSTLTLGIIPEHIWAQIAPERMRLAQRNLQPIGTGPFKFKRLVKDDTGYIYRYELERNEKFYMDPPFIKDFAFQFFTDYAGEVGALQALREQKVDGLSFVPSDLQERAKRKHLVLHILTLPQYDSLFFNMDKENLKDKDIRSALSLAIDKEQILKQAINGDGKVVNSPILPGFPGFKEELFNQNTYNLEEANNLLDKSWKRVSADDYKTLLKDEMLKEWESERKKQNAENNVTSTPEEEEQLKTEELAKIEEKINSEINPAQSFFRQNKNKEFLTMQIVTADTPEFKKVAELVAGFWQDIGVVTKIKYVAIKDFNKEVLKPRDYDVLLYGVIIGSDPDQFPFWHSSQVDFPGLNLSRYVNRNVDALLVEAQKESDDNKLNEIYNKIQDIILAEKPAVFLFMPTYTYVTSVKLQGVDVKSIVRPADRFADVTTWYIKTKNQWKLSK